MCAESVIECSACHQGSLIGLWSTNQRICATCKSVFTWKLKEGQPSLLIRNKVGSRAQDKDWMESFKSKAMVA